MMIPDLSPAGVVVADIPAFVGLWSARVYNENHPVIQ
jgi:hypothetical protein